MAITKISTVTVGAGGAASIDFTSIPGTYTDLMLVVSARSSSTGIQPTLTINGSSASQSNRFLFGDGAGVTSSTASSIWSFVSGSTFTANTFGSTTFYFPNYAGATNKSISIDTVSENNGTSSYADISAALWSSTAAITSLSVVAQASNSLVQYSTATLYGITKGSSGGVTVS